MAADTALLGDLSPPASRRPALPPLEGTYLAWVDCSDLGLTDPATSFREQGQVAFSPGVNWSRAFRLGEDQPGLPELITEAVRRMAGSVDA